MCYYCGHISVENSGRRIASMKLGQRVKRVDSTGELVSKPYFLAHFQKIVFRGYQFRHTVRYISKLQRWQMTSTWRLKCLWRATMKKLNTPATMSSLLVGESFIFLFVSIFDREDLHIFVCIRRGISSHSYSVHIIFSTLGCSQEKSQRDVCSDSFQRQEIV